MYKLSCGERERAGEKERERERSVGGRCAFSSTIQNVDNRGGGFTGRRQTAFFSGRTTFGGQYRRTPILQDFFLQNRFRQDK